MNHVLPLAAATFLAATVAAQCPFQVASVSTYGTGCGEVPFDPPQLRIELTSTCDLSVTSLADSGCCNTFLQATVLIVGAQPVNVPLPFLDPNCPLLAQPDATFVHFGPGPATFAFPLAPGMQPFTVFAQAAAGYYTTITFPAPPTLDFTLSQGHRIQVL
jgi:hypothetical protein